MADMELVIKLGKEEYINIKNAINSLIENGVERTSMSKVCLAILDGTPLPKEQWIFKKTVFDKFGNTVECSSCHKKWKTYDEIRWRKENKFCPNCGADMRGEE